MRMRPIFVFLCLIAIGLMCYSGSLGWRLHQEQLAKADPTIQTAEPDPEQEEGLGLFNYHFLWGAGTGIFVCFVHSIFLVYLLGTGKAIKEQTELQNWSSEHHDQTKVLMSKALVPSSIGLILILSASLSGGPTMIQFFTPEVHLGIILLGTFGQIPVFFRQYVLIFENGKLMDKVLDRLAKEEIRIAV